MASRGVRRGEMLAGVGKFPDRLGRHRQEALEKLAGRVQVSPFNWTRRPSGHFRVLVLPR